MNFTASLLQRLLFLFSPLFILFACHPHEEPLRVAAAPWPSYEFLFLAEELGYLPENKYSLFELPSSSSVMQAFQTDKLDVAFLSLDEVLTLIALGIDLKIINVIDHSMGADALLVKPEIKTIEQLVGRTVGHENKAAGSLLLQELFSISNLTEKNLHLIEIKQNEALKFYFKGNISGLIVREPEKQQLLQMGAKELFNSNRLQQRIMHVMIARSDVIEQQEEKIVNLVKNFYNAHEYYLQNEIDAVSIMSLRLPIFPYLLTESFKGTHFIEPKNALIKLSGFPSNLSLQASNLSHYMQQKNIIDIEPENLESYISTSILEKVIYE